jgi:hypothetical protein
MSIPVRVDWYNQDGELMVQNRGYFTISYGEDPKNLTTLLSHMRPTGSHREFIRANVRYAVPRIKYNQSKLKEVSV